MTAYLLPHTRVVQTSNLDAREVPSGIAERRKGLTHMDQSQDGQISTELFRNAELFLQDLNDGLRTPEGLQSVADRLQANQTADQLTDCTNYQAIKVALDRYNA